MKNNVDKRELDLHSLIFCEEKDLRDLRGVLETRELKEKEKIFFVKEILLWRNRHSVTSKMLKMQSGVLKSSSLDDEFLIAASRFVAAWIVCGWEPVKNRGLARGIETSFRKHYGNNRLLFEAVTKALMNGKMPFFFRSFLEFSLGVAYNEQKSLTKIFAEQGGIDRIKEEYDYTYSYCNQ